MKSAGTINSFINVLDKFFDKSRLSDPYTTKDFKHFESEGKLEC
jgi:hypothetical protein